MEAEAKLMRLVMWLGLEAVLTSKYVELRMTIWGKAVN
jgi:hypothetical protein